MKISIVMAYHNRRNQLLKTLDSIRYFGNPEIIIVDDASDERIDDIRDITLIRIEPEQKKWVNSCIPYNIGFAKAKGDVIIIQNPECIHIGDILKYTENLKEGIVFSHGAYSLDYHLDYEGYDFDSLKYLIMKEPQRCQIEHHGWYNHSKYRPAGYHFCMSMTRTDLEKLGGFDETYAKGVGFEDDDLVRRIKKAGMNLQIIDDPFVIHQKHKRTNYMGIWDKRMLNNDLFLKAGNGPIKSQNNKYYGF
jgi:GT2 family glycosyltransferase